MATRIKTMPNNVLAHISTLRHIINLLTTTKNCVDALEVPDKQSEEGIKGMEQNIMKALTSANNELGRYKFNKGE